MITLSRSVMFSVLDTDPIIIWGGRKRSFVNSSQAALDSCTLSTIIWVNEWFQFANLFLLEFQVNENGVAVAERIRASVCFPILSWVRVSLVASRVILEKIHQYRRWWHDDFRNHCCIMNCRNTISNTPMMGVDSHGKVGSAETSP